ncbi:MAG TPA: hypothetical protein VFM64_00205 [Candidatus Nitrosotenuis sp.]|nr:hypothetical protein [Candidatus Nitrosotenuis sp.]
MDGLGKNLTELKLRIQMAQDDLGKLSAPEQPLPEVINMTNLLRSNEYLIKSDERKTALISAYAEYSTNLEQIVKSLLSIQADLRDIVRTEASIIGSQKPTKKANKSRKKPKKKTKK